MNIIEKSKEYAEGKALNAITSAIEEAYAAGYKAGYSDGQANREEPPFEAKYANLKYIDLELPSGTKWATGYLKLTNGSIALLERDKAISFNLPTKEQYQELLDYTEQFFVNRENGCGTEFVSKKNGARFFIPRAYYYNGDVKYILEDNYVFWLKDHGNPYDMGIGVYGALTKPTKFWHRLPVVLVSK